MRNRSQIFTEAHKLARWFMSNNEFSLYKDAFKESLRRLWFDTKTLSGAKKTLTAKEINYLLSNVENNSIHIPEQDIDLGIKFKTYAWKCWPVNMGLTLIFNNDFLTFIK